MSRVIKASSALEAVEKVSLEKTRLFGEVQVRVMSGLKSISKSDAKSFTPVLSGEMFRSWKIEDVKRIAFSLVNRARKKSGGGYSLFPWLGRNRFGLPLQAVLESSLKPKIDNLAQSALRRALR
jgi:hypothetical protein